MTEQWSIQLVPCFKAPTRRCECRQRESVSVVSVWTAPGLSEPFCSIQHVESVATRQWEKSLWLAVQVSRPAYEKRQRGKNPWACHCCFHGYTHLAQLFLIFLLCLFTSSICNFLSDMISVRSVCIASSWEQFVFLCRGICLSAGTAWTSLLVASCCLHRVK